MKFLKLTLVIFLTLHIISCNNNDSNEIETSTTINQISKNVVYPDEEIKIIGAELNNDIIIEFNDIIIEPISVNKTEIVFKVPLNSHSGDLKISYNENSFKEFIKILDENWTKIETDKSFSKIYFLENNIAYASIEGENESRLYKSIDGGEIWSEILKSNEVKPHFLFTTPNSDIVYAKESSHLFKKSTDGGNTWNDLNILSIGYDILDITFVDENVGYLTTTKYNTNTDSVDFFIMKTMDGGYTWNTSTSFDSEEKLRNLRFIYNNDNHIYLYNKRSNFLMFTDDSGMTWIQKEIELPSNTSLLGKSLFIKDENNFWLGGNDALSFDLFKLKDQKESFDHINKIPLFNNEHIVSFRVFDEQNIYAISNKGANYYTTNGGNTWKTFYLDKEVQINNVFYNSDMVLVLSNGYLYKKEI